MFDWKYMAGVRAAKSEFDAYPTGALPAFDFGSIEDRSIRGRLSSWASARGIAFAIWLSRTFFPVLRIGRFVILSRHDQVVEALENDADFLTPFGPEMEGLARGATFVLGLDGEPRAKKRTLLQSVIKPKRDEAMLADLAERFSAGLLENSAGRIDAVRDLIKRVSSEAAARYCGLWVEDADTFADWGMATSAMIFADPFVTPRTRAGGLNAAARLRAAIDDAIDRAHRNKGRGDDTLVDRLVTLQESGEEGASDAEIRAMLFGLITGFVPTNTLAGSKMLGELLARPAILKRACEVAAAGDRATLRALLLECGRFRPALAPGQFRYCFKDTHVTVGAREVTIPADSVVLVSTMSAMRDSRAFPSPRRFWPERTRGDGTPASPDLIFGAGVHSCVGNHFAMTQLTEIFIQLLAQPGLRAKGGMAHVAGFPRHQIMAFDTPLEHQNMFLVVARTRGAHAKTSLDAAIAHLGHPADDPIRSALDDTGIVHFASLSAVQTGEGDDARVDLIFELSVDGPVTDALDVIAEHAGGLLSPIFDLVGNDDATTLAAFMKANVLELHSAPWGATGLNFPGIRNLSIRTIERQAELARIAGKALEKHLGRYAQNGSRAMIALTHVRRIIADDRYLRLLKRRRVERTLSRDARKAGLDAFVLKPCAQDLDIAKWREPSYYNSPWQVLFAPVNARTIFVTASVLLLGLAIWVARSQQWPQFATEGCGLDRMAAIGACNWSAAGTYLWLLLLSGLGGLVALLALAGAIALPLVGYLRWKEDRDIPDSRAPELVHVREIDAHENHQSYAQNHVMAVGTLKPGPFRKLVHAASLFGIGWYLQAFFRPGFIVNFGTIHFARWWRLPGTDRAIFFSNYDGSWESYLEDFITRASRGQTAAWSNWLGFPKTRFLILDGARNGDAFKRWVRRQQVVAPFWYSRFPQLTTDEMRNNAVIHHGLARASNDSEAREWLRCFGSVPRTANMIETDEVQSLVFSGLGRLRHAAALFVRLPADPQAFADWQMLVAGQRYPYNPADKALSAALTASFLAQNKPLPAEMRIAFGDRNIGDRRDERGATFVAFSAAGLEAAGRWQSETGKAGSDIPDQFPAVFRMGMSARSEVLGDRDASAPGHWRWSDAATEAGASTATVAEAMLYLFAKDRGQAERLVANHVALLAMFGGSVVHLTQSAIPTIDGVADGFGFEHFGFRDGISQPVMRGTGKFGREPPGRDIVEPGEFILGYLNNQGYRPPSPLVRAEADYANDLPIVQADDLSRFPDFGAVDSKALLRDFGRNGTYLVVRELAQDIEGFRAFTSAKAASLRARYRQVSRTINHAITADWVAAKMVGRWPDGRPLAAFPAQKDGRINAVANFEERANDFAYGIADPQGLACPFAAHIRRANPRDSKSPGDTQEQIITNRHRLLRRGRSYEWISPADQSAEKGLLFVAACGDIERQFEFVQQTWINSPKFHGLSNEPDPLVGPFDLGFPDRSFTIPTAAGPLRLDGMQTYVTVRSGGYFFAPSRAALIYLARLAERAAKARSMAP